MIMAWCEFELFRWGALNNEGYLSFHSGNY